MTRASSMHPKHTTIIEADILDCSVAILSRKGIEITAEERSNILRTLWNRLVEGNLSS